MDFSNVKAMTEMFRTPWDIGILRIIAEDGPLRYREIGPRLAAWSGQHTADSVLTRGLRRLEDAGLVVADHAENTPRAHYHSTVAGRARLETIARTVAAYQLQDAAPTGGVNVTASGPPQPGVAQRSAGQPSAPIGTSVADGNGWTGERSVGHSEAMEGPSLDTNTPHPARRYNYWLGGKDNFAADRESGDLIARHFPSVRTAAIENRLFLKRAVQFLVRDAGIRQILDCGTGIPISPNTHEIAQELAPDTRVVYVDNDPMVLSHARALLTGTPEGPTAYIDADLRQPERIITDPDLVRTLDLREPVALLLIAVLHFIEDADALVSHLLRSLPSGSYLVVTNVTTDLVDPELAARAASIAKSSGVAVYDRTHDQVAAFFRGLELVPPGVVPVSEWHDDRQLADRPSPQDAPVWGAIARKP